MRVGVNCRILSKPDPAGTARYTRDLLDACLDVTAAGGPQFSLYGLSSPPDDLVESDRLDTAGPIPSTHSGLRAHAWEQFTLPRALDREVVDVFHTPSGHPPILASVPTVTTVHDISPITHPEWFSTRYAALYRALLPLAIRTSDRIITVSEFARSEIVEQYPAAAGKTVAIHNGIPTRAGVKPDPVPGIEAGEFLLFVGSMNPRKNIRRLVTAYAHIRRRTTGVPPLVLAGPDKDNFAASGLPDVAGVRTLGFVPDGQLQWLYQNARALVFPSLYEGFGLPILEAMAAGTPVVTSNRGAMAEVAGDAARQVEPEDVTAIAAGIEELLVDEEYADSLRKAGIDRATSFTWEQTARETLEVYAEVAEESTTANVRPSRSVLSMVR